MRRVSGWVGGRWAVVVAGVLILAAFAASRTGAPPQVRDVLMVAAAVVAGSRIALAAVRALGARTVGIDLLVTVAAVGAVVVGEYWEAAAVTFLFALGHALEAATLNRTRSALTELVAVAPERAVVVRGTSTVDVPAAEVRPGETVVVRDGAKVPVDGEVVGGHGVLDEASITGESMPVEKQVGDRVFAGTISRGGMLRVSATGVGADTTLARIIRRVEDAQDAQAPTQRFLDRFSRWYTPGAMALALVVGLVTRDVTLALTLLVISCPGALVISIPVAVVAGIGRAARDGILVKGGEFLETAARIDTVALDKTGTLTTGRPRVTDVVPLGTADRDEVLRWAALAEAGSDHPLARPVVEEAARTVGEPGLPDTVETVTGRGVVARAGWHEIAVGTAALLSGLDAEGTSAAAAVADDLAAQGRTPMLVGVDGRVVGVIGLADGLRPDAAATVAALRRAGVRSVVMLTGDAPRVAQAVGEAAGIDEVRAGLLPEDKAEAVAELQRAGATVAMVGDGVNDAPALATADVGVAMGAAGSAVAVETADVALLADRLDRLPEAVGLARRTVRTMRQNVVVAVLTVALLLAGVLAGGVTMAIGMLVHEASVLVVILNAMRLLRPVRTSSAGRGSASIDGVVTGVQVDHHRGATRCADDGSFAWARSSSDH